MKKKFTIELAGIVFDILHKDDYIFNQCSSQGFIDEQPAKTADVTIDIDDDTVNFEQDEAIGYPFGYCESVAIYRAIGKALIPFNAFIFHGAALKVGQDAYLFSGRSGAGKSTHIKQWLHYHPDLATVINGDKPIIRYIDGQFVAFGTPWNGKEGFGTRSSAPIKQLYYIVQAKEDRCELMDNKQAIHQVLNQVYFTDEAANATKQFMLLNQFITSVSVYTLYCTPTEDAVRAVMATMELAQ